RSRFSSGVWSPRKSASEIVSTAGSSRPSQYSRAEVRRGDSDTVVKPISPSLGNRSPPSTVMSSSVAHTDPGEIVYQGTDHRAATPTTAAPRPTSTPSTHQRHARGGVTSGPGGRLSALVTALIIALVVLVLVAIGVVVRLLIAELAK